MTDSEFCEQMLALVEQGKSGLPAMREMLRPEGQLERLVKLAARGAIRAKRATPKIAGTFLPDNFPDDVAKERAVAYWRKHGRPDLEPRIEEQADKFRVMYDDKSCAKWPGRWATFYMNAIDFTRPAQGSARVLSLAAVFEDADIPTWIERLKIFAGLAEDMPKGSWHVKWGPAPSRPESRVPVDAQKEFDRKYGPSPELRLG